MGLTQKISAFFKATNLGNLGLVIAFLALLATAYQNWYTRDTTRRGMRAYVGMTSATIKPTEPTEEPNEFRIIAHKDYDLTKPHSFLEVRITNSGSTPALQVQTYITAGIFTTLPDRPSQFTQANTSGLQKSPFVLSKDQPTYLSLNSPWISDEDYKLIRTGKRLLAAFGYVEYMDIFDVGHRTEYCVVYSWREDNLIPCHVGNNEN